MDLQLFFKNEIVKPKDCIILTLFLILMCRHKSQERRGTDDLPKLNSVRGSSAQDKLTPMRDGLTPVRISRKDLRRMSDEELIMRKSAVGHDTALAGWYILFINPQM